VTPREIGSLVAAAGLSELPAGAAERFSTYLDLLLRWNAKLNLTAVREPEAIVRRHFLESIQCAQLIPQIQTLLDFGSGAGFPGIPIVICRPEIEVTLAESQRKKAVFLREATRQLDLKAEVFAGRVEDMDRRREFGAVTLRAVDKMEAACSEALSRVSKNGWLVIFSGEVGNLRDQIGGVSWEREEQIVASTGRLLFGRKLNVPRETHLS
jgi:16S rRNA (guanine527-N7)-methyltransferase